MVAVIKDMNACHNYLIARVDKATEKVTGRHDLIVPAQTDGLKVTGTVVSVGPTCRVKELVPGSRILFPPYGAGERHNIEGLDYIVLLDWEVLGIFN